MRARHLIKSGARWRVGDGHRVRIFLDKWLPIHDGVLASHSGELNLEATVSQLINQSSGWWNIQLIDHCFHPPDASQIKALPLCSSPQPDVLIWPLEKSDKYSVKLIFRLLCDGQVPAAVLNPADSENRVFWKKL